MIDAVTTLTHARTHARTIPETQNSQRKNFTHTREKHKEKLTKKRRKIHDRVHAPLQLIVFVRFSLCCCYAARTHLDGEEECACARNDPGEVRACRSLAKKSLNLSRFTSALRENQLCCCCDCCCSITSREKHKTRTNTHTHR